MVESFTVSAESAEGVFFEIGSVTTGTPEIVGTEAKSRQVDASLMVQ